MRKVEISEKNFDEVVREGKTFLYFTASFSPFALRMEPVYRQFEAVAADYEVKLCRISLTDQLSLGQRLQIRELPCMLLFVNGMKADACSGIVPLERYVNMLKFF